jgi:CHAT domain-containing protein
MKRFYTSLNAGAGKLDALHGAKLAMLEKRRKERDAAHPFYWASFILVGEGK